MTKRMKVGATGIGQRGVDKRAVMLISAMATESTSDREAKKKQRKWTYGESASL
jgi:hypothetical protein